MEYLVELFRFLFRFIPWFKLVYPDEMGIRIWFGNRVRTVGPGLWFYWGVISDIFRATVTPQIVNLSDQTVDTKDGVSKSFGLTIKYEIVDIQKALLKVHNYDDAIQNAAMVLAARFVSGVSKRTCKYQDLCDEVSGDLEEEAKEWGLNILEVGITDLTTAQVYRIICNTPLTPVPLPKHSEGGE